MGEEEVRGFEQRKLKREGGFGKVGKMGEGVLGNGRERG